jgi:hypothetical protein
MRGVCTLAPLCQLRPCLCPPWPSNQSIMEGGWVTRTWCVCSGSVVRRISVGYLLSGTTMSACAEPRWRRPSSISSAGIRTGRESPSSRLPRLAYNMSDNLERFLANGTSSSLSLSEYVLACFYHSCTELLQCVNSSIFFILEL